MAMNRWLARELALMRDTSLIGFWPLMDDNRDYSGLSHHGETRDTNGVAIDNNLIQSVCGKRSFHTGHTDNTSGALAGVAPPNSGFLECQRTSPGNFDFAFTPSSRFTVSFWYFSNLTLTDSHIFGGIVSKNESTLNVNGYQGWTLFQAVNSIGLQFRSSDGSSIIFLNETGGSFFGSSENPDEVMLSMNRHHEWVHVTLIYDADVTSTACTLNQTQMLINGRPTKVVVTPAASSSTGTYPVPTSTATSTMFPENYYPANFFPNDYFGRGTTVVSSGMDYGTLKIGAHELSFADQFLVYSKIFAVSAVNIRLLRIYNRALTEQEAVQIYKRERDADSYRPRIVSMEAAALGLTLFMTGHDSSNSNITLFTGGLSTATSSTTLYVNGTDSTNSNSTLYTYGSDVSNSNITLFVNGVDTNNSNTTLYTYGSDVLNSGVPLYVNGNNGNNQSLTLFTQGFDGSNSNITMFVNGVYGLESSTTLYTYGSDTPSSSITLFTQGAVQQNITGATTLFTQGFSSSNSNITMFVNGVYGLDSSTTLYISGDRNSSSMNLFLMGDPVPNIDSATTLYVRGSNADNEMANGISLFVLSGDDGNKLIGSMPLFIQVENSSTKNRSMNLWVGGENQVAQNSMTLFLYNTQTVVNSDLTLFVQGDGVSDGAAPLTSNMNLFLQRNPGSAITLFVSGPGDVLTSNVPLYVSGSVQQTGSIQLSIPKVTGYTPGSMQLFTSGF
jgi:hypothetical protein